MLNIGFSHFFWTLNNNEFIIQISSIFVIFFLIENNAYSLSDYQIKQICKNRPRKSSCVKDLKSKKLNLLRGDQIEIPVIPYKK